MLLQWQNDDVWTAENSINLEYAVVVRGELEPHPIHIISEQPYAYSN